MYRAIYFDAGSTVLHSHPRKERILLSLLSLGFSVEDDQLQEAMQQAHEQVWPEMRQARTLESEVPLWYRYYRVLLEALAMGLAEGDDAFIRELQESAHYGRWTAVYPDVPGCLELLSEMGYRLGIISNAPPSLHQVLDRIELAPYFDSIVVSAVVGVSKPDERIYRIALDDLGVAPEEAIFVDDRVENVAAAEALGFSALLIDRDGRQIDVEHTVVTDLGDIVQFVAELRDSEATGQ